MSGPFLSAYIQVYNAIFVFVFASVVYAVVRTSMSCSLHHSPSAELETPGHSHVGCH